MDKSQGDDFSYFDHTNKKENETEVASNKKFEEDVKYAIELNRIIASIIGVWPIFPIGSKTSKDNFAIFLKRIKNGFLYLLLAFLLIPGILHIVLEEHTLKRRILKV